MSVKRAEPMHTFTVGDLRVTLLTDVTCHPHRTNIYDRMLIEKNYPDALGEPAWRVVPLWERKTVDERVVTTADYWHAQLRKIMAGVLDKAYEDVVVAKACAPELHPETTPHPRCERPNCPEQLSPLDVCMMCARLRSEDEEKGEAVVALTYTEKGLVTQVFQDGLFKGWVGQLAGATSTSWYAWTDAAPFDIARSVGKSATREGAAHMLPISSNEWRQE